jgi:hypothetical protein
LALGGHEEFSYSADLAGSFSATARTTYYVAVLNSDANWLWQLDTSGKNFDYLGGEGTPWNSSFYDNQDAFQLTDATTATPNPPR